jgi:hypothetical protein
MRKPLAIFTALAVTLMSFVALSPAGIAHTEDDPFVTDLIAGGGNPASAIDVGDVLVWNDADYLYIKYVTTDDWCMSETHLHVALSLEEIPQKNGNPIPGQFQYNDDHDPCVMEYIYTLSLEEHGFEVDDELYIAAHAVVQQDYESLIDFESYSEHDFVMQESTDCGDVDFYITASDPLVDLEIGDVATLTASGYYPEVGAPDTSPPYTNIVAFTVDMRRFGGSNPHRDDYVRDDGGTGAGGMVLTDPQDESQTELLWHAYSQYLAILLDLSSTEDLKGVDLAGIDLDWGEIWHFQYFDSSNALIHEITLGPSYAYTGDGAAFPITYFDPVVSKIAIWGSNNLGERERIGYAIDNLQLTCVNEETAWGDGEDFPGRNWATYFTYTVQEITIITFPEDGTAYIGYEDRPVGYDHDYNDFGMNMYVQETYVNDCLSAITMEFTSIVRLAGDRHDIHILRTLSDDTEYTYTIERSTSAQGTETPEVTGASGSGDFDIVLFDTIYFTVDDTVTIDIAVTSCDDYYDPSPTPPRWDLDPVFAYYDPWMKDKSYGPNYWYIDSEFDSTKWGDPSPGITVPYIIVVPYLDWPAPGEGVIITNPYPDFDDYYRTHSAAYEDWYLP